MNQCDHCGSYNDQEAAFCNQCGGRLSAARRGAVPAPASVPRARERAATSSRGSRAWLGPLLLAGLLAALVGVFLVTQWPEEPTPDTHPPRVAVSPVEAPASSSRPPPASDTKPTPVEVPTIAPVVVSDGTPQNRVGQLVSSALVVLELVDDQERVTELRGVLVDPSGVVLCRFASLIGARSGKARLLVAEKVRTDVLGLSFRDEAADLALVRLAPLDDPFPWVPLSGDSSGDLDEGSQLFAFNDYRPIPAVIEALDHVGPDGVRRLLIGPTSDGMRLPRRVFVVVDEQPSVIGLCRPARPLSPAATAAAADLISVDAVAVLRESLHLPVGMTLGDLTDRLYAGTFPDLRDRGKRAFRQREWLSAIELFENALERVALDAPPDEQVDEVNRSLRESYLREVERLAAARRYREASALASQAVARYERDAVLWRLAGEILLTLDQNADGIAALLESRSLEPSPDIDATLEAAYLKVAIQHRQVGAERLAELSLLEGIEALPNSASLYIELGKLHIRFEAYDSATDLLEQARTLDATRSAEIDSLLATIENALRSRNAVVIPMNSSNSIRALALVDGREEMTFIVDTGATFTAIPESVAIELGYDVRKAEKVTVRTAGGGMRVPMIRMESVSVGGFTVRNLRVLALPDDLAPGVYLLGLNYLNHFKYTVDAQRREFRIEPAQAE